MAINCVTRREMVVRIISGGGVWVMANNATGQPSGTISTSGVLSEAGDAGYYGLANECALMVPPDGALDKALARFVNREVELVVREVTR